MENEIKIASSEPEKKEAESFMKMPEQGAGEVKKKNLISKRTMIIAICVAVVIIIAAMAYHYRGLFVAATVNGVPISRVAVIGQLEKQYGSTTLGTMINQMLLDNEARKRGIAITTAEVDAAVKSVEDQVKAQGQTMDEALAAQGLTLDEFRKQIVTQKELENMLADKTQVTDAEIDQYIKDNKITVPKGQEATYRGQIKQQLAHQKLLDQVTPFIDSLRAAAKIQYFVNY